ncbi:nuclear pore complex protein NUP155 [Magnolia sinica]|uniref:nuclear pore complex protein NUP155 n=1 Tax=Magnolia sinica TaxID=86752 RepID=UPI002658E91F|nr:nuclear pore complex protein NUP155 [Magnolia sinica]
MSWEDETVGPDIASAGRLISDRIGRDVAAQLDLEEALEASRYASHPYSSHPKEWPPLVEVVDTRELPPVLIERYNAAGGEGTALCGIFPEIRRAWASVDNSLFLWRFDKWDGQCPEYSVEEQAICAVGLVKSKRGIFVGAIQYLLVLATPVELILVGVCCTGRGEGTDPYVELSLQPLPEYTIPSDGVTMTCITCTDKGHIFLAGRDGHIYEMQYTTGSGWHKRCRKVCLTAGLGSLISRWVLPNVFKFGAVDPIVEMVVDNERHILYARTEDMKLQVFDLGVNGDGPLKRIAEERNLIDQRDGQYGGRRSAGSRAVSRAAKPSIVCIAPLSTLESKWLHLVAVLSDGRRMYLSTAPSGGNNSSVGGLAGLSNAHQRPCCLKAVTIRPSPPLGVGGGLTYGSVAGRSQTDDLTLKIETAYYSAGTLVLSDSSPPTMSSLLIINRDPSTQSSISSNFGMSSRSSRALRESVSSLPIEGRMLFVTDVLPLPDMADTVLSLYSDVESCVFEGSRESCEKATVKLWARGDLATQHILPRRRVVAFSTMGMMEVVFNRPVDILRRLLESNAPRSILEDFFNRFGAGEAAAMCLMLAAKLVYVEDNLISNTIAEKAAEAFEDPRVVGMPQLEGSSALANTRTPPGGFSMGQVVQEAEPVFSGAHEGLCLCSSRLLYPVWELPVMIVRGEVGSDVGPEKGVVVCRLSVGAMQVMESKIRSLEQFLRSRRNQRRGLYGCVAGMGDITGSILYGTSSDLGAGDRNMVRNLFGTYSRNMESSNGVTSGKRQRLPYSPAELAAMEVRAMECVRRLLRRSGEALFLLHLLSHHHVARLVQSLDANLRQQLVQLTFHQLVCSEEGDLLATRLIAALMQYYVGPDGRGTVDDISGKLREGCPSYYNESDYKFFLAVECLERAAVTADAEEKDKLARDAFSFLTKVPDSADLGTVCKRFEDLRFYEAVVQLPLQKAQALDPSGDALNEKVDASRRENALAQRKQCYEIIINALRSLKGDVGRGSQREFGTPVRPAGTRPVLDQASRDTCIRQIVQLSVQWPDRAFHEHLYRAMIDMGLENELLEYGGSDLVPFLQSAGREPIQEVQAISTIISAASPIGHMQESTPNIAKYLELLARYYVLKRQHILAAHVLLRLAERRHANASYGPTLEQRRQYLINAVLQAKNASSISGPGSSAEGSYDNGLLDLVEGKLAVLRFQMKIKEELEAIASRLEDSSGTNGSPSDDASPQRNLVADANIANAARDKTKELSLDLKSITQLYNEYAVPFELWEICLEMLNFANYSGDIDSAIVRETWARLLDQALSRGGVAEACAVIKRVGSQLYPGDGASLPLDNLCLHLEKAALERFVSGAELVGDEDVARALLAACKGAAEPVLSVYDKLLTNGAIFPSLKLRLRLLRSVLVVLREWAMSLLAQKMGTSTTGASLILGGTFKLGQTSVMNQGVRDKITSAANRYMTEVRRLALPQSETEAVYQGFRELEETLMSPIPFEPF